MRSFFNLAAASAAVTAAAITVVAVFLGQHEAKQKAERAAQWLDLSAHHSDLDKHLDRLWDTLK